MSAAEAFVFHLAVLESGLAWQRGLAVWVLFFLEILTGDPVDPGYCELFGVVLKRWD